MSFLARRLRGASAQEDHHQGDDNGRQAAPERVAGNTIRQSDPRHQEPLLARPFAGQGARLPFAQARTRRTDAWGQRMPNRPDPGVRDGGFVGPCLSQEWNQVARQMFTVVVSTIGLPACDALTS